MRQETSNRKVLGLGFGAMAVAALAGAVALIAAGPARANNEFQNGFEDQLGRIAAYGAVNLGLQVLSGGYYPVVPVAPVVHASYYGPRKLVVRHAKVHRHDKFCSSRYGRHGKHYGKNYRNDYDDDRGHRSHGKQYRDGRDRGW